MNVSTSGGGQRARRVATTATTLTQVNQQVHGPGLPEWPRRNGLELQVLIDLRRRDHPVSTGAPTRGETAGERAQNDGNGQRFAVLRQSQRGDEGRWSFRMPSRGGVRAQRP